MLDPVLRPVKDRLLAPLARAAGPRIHPNVISLVGFGIGIGCVFALARGEYGAAAGLGLLNRLLDGLDGAVARAHHKQTDFGGYLDLLLDFVLYALIPIGLVLGVGGEASLFLWLALLLGSFYVNAASWMFLAAIFEKRALGASVRGEQTSVTMPTGLIEGTETIVLFTLCILFPAALIGLFALMTVAVCLTIVQRVVWATRHL